MKKLFSSVTMIFLLFPIFGAPLSVQTNSAPSAILNETEFLIMAIRRLDFQKVKFYVEKNEKLILNKNHEGKSPIEICFEVGKGQISTKNPKLVEIFNYLKEIEKKLQTQIIEEVKAKEEEDKKRDYPQKFPLHWAVINFDKPKIKELLSSSEISINAFDFDENTPCDVAKKIPDPGKGLEIFNLLKAAGGATSDEVKNFSSGKSNSGTPQNDTQSQQAETAWEYKTCFFSDLDLMLESFDSRVNKLGQEGWEMISSRRAKGPSWGFEVSLKRQVKK